MKSVFSPVLAGMDMAQKQNYLKITSAWPIFGGEDNKPDDQGDNGTQSGNASGGSSGDGKDDKKDDPIAKLQSDPNALAQLLSQTETLASQVQQLTTENADFKQKQEQAEAAQRSKEENQEIEINNLKAQLENVTNILQQKVIENAIANHAKHQWNSVRQVKGELDMSKLKVNLDIDKGIAEIDGIDAELDRIATSSPWLVKAAEQQPPNPQQPQQRQRTSGGAPRPPAPPADKASKRALAMKKFPVLATGVPPQ
ncbi:hypothetical protein PBI_OAKER_13 [Mycobacterium phage Oaker]|uniref:head scaffolding protein n=1 Tax=Mycobacterium phage Oaker TaxID=1445727 RepID=UPI0003E38592|nr:head scaffolding protein [Mycobacterium phage Oaker]AHG24404.1 hypothetical protein PBI_OAKER_13 [Mycobacterium phage Oaker]